MPTQGTPKQDPNQIHPCPTPTAKPRRRYRRRRRRQGVARGSRLHWWAAGRGCTGGPRVAPGARVGLGRVALLGLLCIFLRAHSTGPLFLM